MANGWIRILLIITLPVYVLAHFILWPPCKENEETILEPGFLIYNEINYNREKAQNTLDVKLFLRDCRFRILKPYAFHNYSISKGSYLANNNFSMTDVELFVKNCSHFETIEFYDDDDDSVFAALMWYGKIPDLPDNCDGNQKNVSYLDGIEDINLSYNQMQLMGDSGMFSSLMNLQTLNLASNLIDKMHENIFVTLSHIRNITLNHNKVSRFSVKLFQNLSNLEELHLSNNLIEYVPAGAFFGTALKKLDLSFNKLIYLPQNFCLDIGKTGASLKVFYFDFNPWNCRCLNDILVEVNHLNIQYNKGRYKGVNPVCSLEKPGNFQCDRPHNSKSEFKQCLMY